MFSSAMQHPLHAKASSPFSALSASRRPGDSPAAGGLLPAAVSYGGFCRTLASTCSMNARASSREENVALGPRRCARCAPACPRGSAPCRAAVARQRPTAARGGREKERGESHGSGLSVSCVLRWVMPEEYTERGGKVLTKLCFFSVKFLPNCW